MALTLYYHPFSSYSWKVLIPLYENATPFVARRLDDPQAAIELKKLWSIERFPVLVDDSSAVTLPESSIIIEYLDTRYPGPQRMLPAAADERLEVRLLDRFIDNYVQGPLQRIVYDRRRESRQHDPVGVEEAHTMLVAAYAWLDAHMAERVWAVGSEFTLADCAAAPALFYADWVHPLRNQFPSVAAYRARLLARHSVKRCVEDAREFRSWFPGGAPDQD